MCDVTLNNISSLSAVPLFHVTVFRASFPSRRTNKIHELVEVHRHFNVTLRLQIRHATSGRLQNSHCVFVVTIS